MRIIFAGTPHFADTALQALLAADSSLNYEVIAVFTQPDRPSGRGMKLTPSPVKQTALTHGIAVYQPRSLKLDGKYPDDAIAAQLALKTLAADVMIVAAYGLILPQWALDMPRAGCINIHASLLPRWRGAAPIQRAIQAGDTASGVGLMHMELGLDTGAVYAQSRCDITPSTTGGQLHDALAALGASLLCQHLPAIVAGTLKPVPQAVDGVNYAHKLLREHGVLDWQLPAAVLANQVRAFDPSHGCSFEHGEIYKVWAAHAINPADVPQPLAVGTVLALTVAGVDIACGDSTVLRITEIQKPGGKRLAVSACWQGLDFNVGF
jgi:methionyl-tRNA formyltransferase